MRKKINKASGGNNSRMGEAKRKKKDEFYTLSKDIEAEIYQYESQFKDQIVFCNCDDPEESNFWKHFYAKFHAIGLKKLISTHYNEGGSSYKLEYDGNEVVWTELEGDGDFRSEECIEILKEATIVVTNPPFSLFREFVALLMEHDKKFLIMGNQNAITYKEIFPLLKDNKLWVGYHFNKAMEFMVPEDYPLTGSSTRVDEDGNKFVKVAGIAWFTNLAVRKRTEELILFRKYDPVIYPKYDNYDAINVNKVADIPCDYDGVMGVPITFMDKYNPDQFEIVSSNDIRTNDKVPYKAHGLIKDKDGTIQGKPTYARILIKRKEVINGN